MGLHLRQMNRWQLVLTVSERLRRRLQRRIEDGRVRLLGRFEVNGKRIIVLRLENWMPKRMLTYIAAWEVRQPGGQYRAYAQQLDGPPPWHRWEEGWPGDADAAMRRLKHE